MNENSAYRFDVEEPAQWVFDGGPTWISGWFLSKVGAVFSDVRAVIAGVPHLGIFGLPREQVEIRHRGYFGLPHAGFILQVTPPRGARDLRLELLDAGNHWVEIWRTEIRVRQGPRPGAKLNAELIPLLLERMLQARRADPVADGRPLAARLCAEAASVPLDTLPNPPFFGALETPRRIGGTQFGKLRLEGWIIHLQQRITRLIATTHPLVENIVAYGDRPRPEAGALFPGHPYAARSQFFGMADIDETAPNPVCLTMFAELEDGTRHLVFTRRVYQNSCNQQERPLPEYSRSGLLRVAAELRRACRAQGIRVGRPTDWLPALREGFAQIRKKAPRSLAHLRRRPEDPYAAWQSANRLTPRLQRLMQESAAKFSPAGPRIALLIDMAGCSAAHLEQLVRSLQAQLHSSWEAWFIGPGGLPPAAVQEPRCHWEGSAGPADILRALNAAAHQSTGTHLALLPGHSRLAPEALLVVAERLAAAPGLELVYTDEDVMDDAGRRTEPSFKPDWSPALALSGLFPGNLSVVRRDRFIELGSFRDGYAAVPWYDLLLRLGDRLRADQVAHLALVGHHGRAALSRQVDPADHSVEEARQALVDTMRRRAWAAEPFLPEAAHQRHLRFHQLQWDPRILSRLQVTIVIPTRDRLHLLQECIELLEETVDWRYVKLVIVDDHSRDADAVRYLAAIEQRKDLLCAVVRPPDPLAPFNYSRLMNLALARVDTPLVLHLNNDVNALERGWLEEMAGWFTLPDVGVVGAKLLWPDKTLNHTGIVIGAHGGLADTPWLKVHEQDVAGVEWHAAAREVSAVTGACLMTRTELYRRLGGFNEEQFGVAYNDVDYCLRARAAGHRVLYTPQAKLMHWGSATRGVTFDEEEHIAFVRKYPAYRDPYLNPNLELADGRVRCRGAVCAHTARAGPLRLLLITHNLNLEGSPLFLLEYATWLVRQAGCPITVLSCEDGPLRSAYEALGATITLIDRHRLFSADSAERFAERVAEVRFRLPMDSIDLVVCNTLVSFWGVHLARQAGKPSLFQIHESTSVFRFFERMLPLPQHAVVEQAFREATRVFFLCRATRAYYEDLNVRDNFRIVPSWIRIDEIEDFKRGHSRADLRRKHGFRDDEVVIANIGTVCERKGQHTFIRAVEHFNHHNQGCGRFRFVLVGARPGIYLDWLTADIDHLCIKNLTLVPETREVFDFFQLCDLFVCTSYEESFPRVVMEAMAFRTPMVTTDVHGIAELVRQRAEAYLVKPGDVAGLSRMMQTCLAKERSGKSLTPTAYSRILRYHDYHQVMPRYLALAQEAWLAHAADPREEA
ncbi:MAG TPA: glycosyltransferase [Opitutaceae bacterium]|nr:glycosyltransferase [Opitutaceae bacterium]